MKPDGDELMKRGRRLLVGNSSVANRDGFEPCCPLLRERFHDIRPAATMWVASLADPCRHP